MQGEIRFYPITTMRTTGLREYNVTTWYCVGLRRVVGLGSFPTREFSYEIHEKNFPEELRIGRSYTDRDGAISAADTAAIKMFAVF